MIDRRRDMPHPANASSIHGTVEECALCPRQFPAGGPWERFRLGWERHSDGWWCCFVCACEWHAMEQTLQYAKSEIVIVGETLLPDGALIWPEADR